MCLSANLLFAGPDYFTPEHRLSGVGVDRAEMTPRCWMTRTDRMIESETFAILREPQAIAGAERITGAGCTRIFDRAAASSGLPASLISAVAYLESWGDANAVSPAGPKGIMQFSEATARAAGLRVVRITRFKITTERKLVSRKNAKPVYRTVRHRTPYTVTVRDDRLNPERAVPAAANYLARLENKFGGRDWAVFAYHCGEGCVSELLPLAQAALGRKTQPTVAGMFFAASPAFHRDLYEALQRHMQRDYSPTYWFRIMRAEQLLNLYRTDRAAFRELAEEYRNPNNPARRANDRLMVWLKSEDIFYRSARRFKKSRRSGESRRRSEALRIYAAETRGRSGSLPAGLACRNRHAALHRVRDAPSVRATQTQGRTFRAAASGGAGEHQRSSRGGRHACWWIRNFRNIPPGKCSTLTGPTCRPASANV